jgi:hypothetical protein
MKLKLIVILERPWAADFGSCACLTGSKKRQIIWCKCGQSRCYNPICNNHAGMSLAAADTYEQLHYQVMHAPQPEAVHSACLVKCSTGDVLPRYTTATDKKEKAFVHVYEGLSGIGIFTHPYLWLCVNATNRPSCRRRVRRA